MTPPIEQGDPVATGESVPLFFTSAYSGQGIRLVASSTILSISATAISTLHCPRLGPLPMTGKWRSDPSMRSAYYQFVQATPSTRYLKIETEGVTSRTGDGWVAKAGGFSGTVFYSANAGDTYTNQTGPVSAGTIGVWVTYDPTIVPPSGITGPLATNAIYTVLDSTGVNRGTFAVDQTKPPSDISIDGFAGHFLGLFELAEPVSGLVIVATVPPGGRPIAVDAVRIERTEGAESIGLMPSDVLTIDSPAGLIVTADGPSPAMVGVPVANLVGQWPKIPPGPKTADFGYNVEIDNVLSLVGRRTNWAERIQGPPGLTSDVNGYPTSSVGPMVQADVLQYTPYYAARNGPWCVMWDGKVSDAAILNGPNVTSTEMVEFRHLTGGADNRRVFHLVGDPGPIFKITLTSATPDPANPGNFLHDATNLRIYPPDAKDNTKPQGIDSVPDEWDGHYIGTALAGAKCLRFLNVLGTNDSANSEESDFIQPERLGYFSTTAIDSEVATVQQYAGSDPAFDLSNRTIVKFTTKATNRITQGQRLYYRGPGHFTLSDGTELPAEWCYGNARVPGDGSVLLPLNNAPRGAKITGFPSGGQLQTLMGGGPVRLVASLANAVASVESIEVPVPNAMSNAGITALFTQIGRELKPGCKILCQYSNETWNSQFGQWDACCQLTRILGLGGFQDFVPGYVTRGAEVHDLAFEALSAIGRGGDLVRVFGSQATNTGVTTAIVNFAKANGIKFDVLAIAPYWNLSPDNVALAYENDLLTTEQQVELNYDALAHNGFMAGAIAPHRKILDDAGLDHVELIAYEYGPDTLYARPVTFNADLRNRAISRHPEFHDWTLACHQAMQDLGITQGYKFNDAGSTSGPAFSTFFECDQALGTGDPAKDMLNASDPEAKRGLLTEIGAGIKDWNSLIPGTNTMPSIQDLRNADISATRAAKEAIAAAQAAHGSYVSHLKDNGPTVVPMPDGSYLGLTLQSDGVTVVETPYANGTLPLSSNVTAPEVKTG